MKNNLNPQKYIESNVRVSFKRKKEEEREERSIFFDSQLYIIMWTKNTIHRYSYDSRNYEQKHHATFNAISIGYAIIYIGFSLRHDKIRKKKYNDNSLTTRFTLQSSNSSETLGNNGNCKKTKDYTFLQLSKKPYIRIRVIKR